MYDIAIIGAGVIGSAIARELSKYEAKICVLEREEDVCCGTSKANSAIIHAGYDATPGTLKAKMNVAGNAMMDELSRDLDFPFKRCGSLVVRTKDQDISGLEKLLEKGKANGVPDLQILDRNKLIQMEPNLAVDVTDALYAPTGAIVCPFHFTIALAENAADNGVDFFLNTEVKNIKKENFGYKITTDSQIFETKAIVNAAGVYADTFNNMVSDHKLNITPRRGQYILLDKDAGSHVSRTIFQLPSKMGKGVLVTPTIHGNLLVGPTAEDLKDKEALNTTAEGLDILAPQSSLSVKNIPYRSVITSFAGLRAHEDSGDFILGEADDAKNFFNAAGIASPGLSSAPAIGKYLAEEVAGALNLKNNPKFNGKRKGILNPSTMSVEERNALIKQNPAYGQIICRCESISEGEILDAIHRTLGARSLDGIKRRTRAGMGRCQSGFCSPKVMEILEREVPMDMLDIVKNGKNSKIVFGYNKLIGGWDNEL
ncbi:MAG: NAD(P)/FAD-dependent oxidoreductase [Lachnospiraceae bacterium]|nr:NAD(P)/FAD-dependent oxidoreductase [Lachnospiraceae bacterium]